MLTALTKKQKMSLLARKFSVRWGRVGFYCPWNRSSVWLNCRLPIPAFPLGFYSFSWWSFSSWILELLPSCISRVLPLSAILPLLTCRSPLYQLFHISCSEFNNFLTSQRGLHSCVLDHRQLNSWGREKGVYKVKSLHMKYITVLILYPI